MYIWQLLTTLTTMVSGDTGHPDLLHQEPVSLAQLLQPHVGVGRQVLLAGLGHHHIWATVFPSYSSLS